MKKLITILSLITVLGLFSNILGADQGKITHLSFCGAAAPWTNHQDIVQIMINGGFSQGGDYAAVKKSDTHLVAALLNAYNNGIAIKVSLGTEGYCCGRKFIVGLEMGDSIN